MTRLNPAQEAALTAITSQRTAYQNEKTQFEARMRAQFEVAMREKEAALHASMYEAFRQGVPKTRIGLAYGTKDPGTVLRIIREQEALRALSPEDTPLAPFEVSVDSSSGSDVYMVKVNSLMLGDYLIEDAYVEFVLDEIGFPMFTSPVDPWENSQPHKIGVLARKIQMEYNSDHPLNKSIRAAKS